MIDYKDFDEPITLENIKGKAVVLDYIQINNGCLIDHMPQASVGKEDCQGSRSKRGIVVYASIKYSWDSSGDVRRYCNDRPNLHYG